MPMGQKPKTGKKDKYDELVKQVEVLASSVRLNQIMIQNMHKALQEIANNTRNNTSVIDDLQFRILALKDINNISTERVQNVADSLKVKAFEEASVLKDQEEKAAAVDQVESEEDIVIIRSKTPDKEKDTGILRSRIQIKDMNIPDLAKKLLGAKVGTEVETFLNSDRHVVTVLGIRRKPVEAPAQTPEA